MLLVVLYVLDVLDKKQYLHRSNTQNLRKPTWGTDDFL